MMKMIIPLAGKGARLRPHTLMTPKPLLKVAGIPILQYLLDHFKDFDFSEIIFITNDQKNKIEEFVSKNYSFKATFIEQKIADGPAGAIRLAKDIIDEDVLILYCDTLFDSDLSIIREVQKGKGVDGLIWVNEVEDYQRFGVVVLDDKGFIKRIVEKPKEPISKLANIGVYYIKDYKLLFEGIEYIYNAHLTVNNEYFLTDAFQYMIDHGSRLRTASVINWYDCGTFRTLLETNEAILKRIHAVNSPLSNSVIISPVYIDKDVIIENSIIGPNVSIASGCAIKNCILRNSIIDTSSQLSDIKLRDSTIGQNAVLTGNYKKLNLGDYSEVHYD